MLFHPILNLTFSVFSVLQSSNHSTDLSDGWDNGRVCLERMKSVFIWNELRRMDRIQTVGKEGNQQCFFRVASEPERLCH